MSVLLATDIVKLIGREVGLKPCGAEWMGNCPFHKDSSMSLIIFPREQLFRCPHCCLMGDAITFVMHYRRLSFPAAVNYLALAAGYNVKVALPVKPSYVYVLELAGGHYYIGFTRQPLVRFRAHFSGKGARFTRLHRPVRVLELHKDAGRDLEDALTVRYIEQFGAEKERGGGITAVKLGGDSFIGQLPAIRTRLDILKRDLCAGVLSAER